MPRGETRQFGLNTARGREADEQPPTLIGSEDRANAIAKSVRHDVFTSAVDTRRANDKPPQGNLLFRGLLSA